MANYKPTTSQLLDNQNNMKSLLLITCVFCLTSCNFFSAENNKKKAETTDSTVIQPSISTINSDTVPELYKLIFGNIDALNRKRKEILEYPNETKYLDDYNSLLLSTSEKIDLFARQDIAGKEKYILSLYYCAEMNEIEPVRNILKNNLSSGSLNATNNIQIVIDTCNIRNFKGYPRVTRKGKVLSTSFEYFNSQTSDNRKHIPYPLHPFQIISNGDQICFFHDSLIMVMSDGGFENSRNIFTVWKKKDDKYYLLTILDNWLNVSIGLQMVDEIITIDRKRKLIVGSSSGGDQGDTWKSIWLGIWEFPRKFKVVYKLETFTSGSDTIFKIADYSYKINKQDLVVEIDEIIKSYIWRNNQTILTDSISKPNIIKVKSLLSKDITSKYNFGERNNWP